jgi:hypothetical protein
MTVLALSESVTMVRLIATAESKTTVLHPVATRQGLGHGMLRDTILIEVQA